MLNISQYNRNATNRKLLKLYLWKEAVASAVRGQHESFMIILIHLLHFKVLHLCCLFVFLQSKHITTNFNMKHIVLV